MQSTIESLISNVIFLFDRSFWAVQKWVRQEIVDDDPCDVDTVFPNAHASEKSDQSKY
jgi:hypothetical protein